MKSAAAKRRTTNPPALAKEWGVNPGKVVEFIQSGELPAINLASKGSSRPRYAILLDDVAAFEEARRVVPKSDPLPARPRRRADAAIKQFV